MSTETRCELSDLPASMCGCPGCMPDAEVLPVVGMADLDDTHPTRRMSNHDEKADLPRPRLRGLAHELTLAPLLWGDLELMATGATGDEPEKVSGGGDERPAPVRAEVVEHRHALVLLLRREVTRLGGSDRDGDVTRMAGTLLALLPDITEAHAAPILDGLRAWRKRARLLLDLPRLRSRLPLGACPNAAGELWACEGLLWALIPADADQLVWAQCDECRERWDVVELPGVSDVYLPLGDVAALSGVPRGTLWHWVDDGVIRETEAGVRLGDVLSHMPRQPA